MIHAIPRCLAQNSRPWTDLPSAVKALPAICRGSDHAVRAISAHCGSTLDRHEDGRQPSPNHRAAMENRDGWRLLQPVEVAGVAS